MRFLGVLLLLGLAWCAHAQVPVNAHVVDAATSEPLPYAIITSMADGARALANADGRFQLTVRDASDSVTVAFLGYRRAAFAARDLIASGVVRMTSSATQLASVTVDGRDERLLDLVLRAGKSLDRLGHRQAKLYYELETRTEHGPVEAIECFYNAELIGADIGALHLKNGRLALAPDEKRYISNLNTSRAFLLLHPIGKGPFPSTPFRYGSRNALRKAYDITLEAISHDPEEVYHVMLEPRVKDGSHFTGELWVEPAGARVRRFELRCMDCAEHPFQSLVTGDSLRNVSLHYAQTYLVNGDRSELDHVELSYGMTYHTSAGAAMPAFTQGNVERDREIHSTGIMHLFDHGGGFIPPVLHADLDGFDDYRSISALPYDSAFWASAPALIRTEQQARDQDLFAAHGIVSGRMSQDLELPHLFESYLVCWSRDHRISLKNTGTPVPSAAELMAAAPLAQRIDLRTAIYLNTDPLPNGDFRTFSATVFDGMHSLYQVPETPLTDLFLNLFFDLCEIERRRMQAELEVPGSTLERITAIHAEAEARMRRSTDKYLNETKRGTDAAALMRWNQVVLGELGIDNAALFHVTTPSR